MYLSCDYEEHPTAEEPQVLTDDDTRGNDTDGASTDTSMAYLTGVTGYNQSEDDVAGWKFMFED